MADKGEKIKDQGFVPYAKQSNMTTSKKPSPEQVRVKVVAVVIH